MSPCIYHQANVSKSVLSCGSKALSIARAKFPDSLWMRPKGSCSPAQGLSLSTALQSHERDDRPVIQRSIFIVGGKSQCHGLRHQWVIDRKLYNTECPLQKSSKVPVHAAPAVTPKTSLSPINSSNLQCGQSRVWTITYICVYMGLERWLRCVALAAPLEDGSPVPLPYV